ncbi:hypothetical protein FH972_022021 [Carpinus fangiana]|uniref:Uncharacterized protein n=1 Tax=Carpinus fangiana TaxID=176857 RepID=A0A5N6KR10_9ROSI|nr:hypothetical protein FH972_022021 [Carpinus fangiana]
MAAPNGSDQLETKLRSMILGNGQSSPAQASQPSTPRGASHHHSHSAQVSRGQDGPFTPGRARAKHGHQPSYDSPNQRGQHRGMQSQSHARGHQRGAHSQNASRDNVQWRGHTGSQAPRPMQRNPGQPQHQPQSHQRGTHMASRPRASSSKFVPLQPDNFQAQSHFLEDVARVHLPGFEMSQEEFHVKDRFRQFLQDLLQRAVAEAYPGEQTDIALQPFGSLSSGFAMPGSDMDLALHATTEHPDIFRVFQRTLLDMGIGARVLSRTRVPIIKICELPTPEILAALREDRDKWDDMSMEEREAHDDGRAIEKQKPTKESKEAKVGGQNNAVEAPETSRVTVDGPIEPATPSQPDASEIQSGKINLPNPSLPSHEQSDTKGDVDQAKSRQPRKERPWYREKRLGPLDFPKSGVGIQCDINYENHLGVHNTALLRCYSHTDVRVRLFVLFVKGWASRRKINSGYNGTLSSYGYVLMVLHYLVNVAHPPVCPNLQLHRIRGLASGAPAPPDPDDPTQVCQGFDVRFWNAEQEIISLAGRQMLTHNREPLGALLRGFFHYYAQQGPNVPRGGFQWTQQVLSLRSPSGVLTKAAKGWTGATTTVQHADGSTTTTSAAGHNAPPAPQPVLTPDPFETSHNVARTVTHPGIVAIRDEFRRAWRILQAVGRGQEPMDGDLMEPVISVMPPKEDEEAKPDPENGDTVTIAKGEVGLGQPSRFFVGKPADRSLPVSNAPSVG